MEVYCFAFSYVDTQPFDLLLETLPFSHKLPFCTFVKNLLTTYLWVCFCSPCYVRVCVYNNTTLPDSWSFVLSPKMESIKPLTLYLFSKCCFGCSRSFVFPYACWNQFLQVGIRSSWPSFKCIVELCLEFLHLCVCWLVATDTTPGPVWVLATVNLASFWMVLSPALAPFLTPMP